MAPGTLGGWNGASSSDFVFKLRSTQPMALAPSSFHMLFPFQLFPNLAAGSDFRSPNFYWIYWKSSQCLWLGNGESSKLSLSIRSMHARTSSTRIVCVSVPFLKEMSALKRSDMTVRMERGLFKDLGVSWQPEGYPRFFVKLTGHATMHQFERFLEESEESEESEGWLR